MGVIRLGSVSWQQLARAVAASESPIAWAWIGARDVNSGEWKLAGLTLRSATSVDTEVLRYPDVMMGREALSPRTAATRLRAGRVAAQRAHGGRLAFEPIAGGLSLDWWTTEETAGRIWLP